MLAPPTPTNQAAPPPGHAQHLTAFLNEFIEGTMVIARELVAGVQAQTTAPPETKLGATTEAANAYDKLGRCLRHSIMLVQRLDDPAPARPAQPLAAPRRQFLRKVEDVIHRQVPEPRERERLQAELLERLAMPELDDDIESRPVADIVDEHCRDLGIAARPPGTRPDKRRTPADIALLCARAAQPPRSAAPHPANPERFYRLTAAPNA